MREGFLNVIKLIAAILLLPVVIAITRGFAHSISELAVSPVLIAGMLTYLIFHHFIVVPEGLFHFGQRIFTDFFRFVSLPAWVPYAIPIYPVFLLIGLWISHLLKIEGIADYVFFLATYVTSLDFIVHFMVLMLLYMLQHSSRFLRLSTIHSKQ